MFHVIVDAQVDFMLPTGKLYVPGAEKIIPNICEYLSKIKKGENILFTFDTHTKDSYRDSEEAKSFPIHCEVGTVGHKLVVPTDITQGNPYYLNKSVFSMWENVENTKVENLWYPDCWYHDTLENFLRDEVNDQEVIVSGVASDFCVRQAIQGFLDRGFKVKVNPLLCCGIDLQIEDVVKNMNVEVVNDDNSTTKNVSDWGYS